MSGPTIERSELIDLACKAGASVGQWGDAVFTHAELETFYRLAYAAGQASERSNIPPSIPVVDSSRIDWDALVESLKNTKSVLLVGSEPNQDEIAAAVAAEREACRSIANDALNAASMSKYATSAECRAARDMAKKIEHRIRARGQQ